MASYTSKLEDIGLTIVGTFTKAKDKHKLRCKTCLHEWSATPVSKIQAHKKHGTNGCPVCNDNRKVVRLNDISAKNIEAIKSRGFELLSEYTKYKSPIRVRRTECSHEWTTTPEHIIGANINCKICNNETKRNRFKEYNNKRREVFLENATDWERYRADVDNATRRVFNEQASIINPDNNPRGLAGQDGAYQLDHIISVRWCFDNNVPIDSCSDISNLQFIPWEENLAKKNKFHFDYIPSAIQPYFDDTSGPTQCIMAIRQMLNSAEVDFEVDSNALNPYRVNLFIPQNNLAIRVYDVNEEQEQRVQSSKIQHNILKVAKTRGITVLQIFSDEWVINPDLILTKIAHLCQANIAVPRIHARQCSISLTPNDIKNTFMDLYHIQGHDRSQINIGAYHPDNPDRLIALMTFCKPRILMGRNAKVGSWELSRFATDSTVRIPGIASRLLKHFQRNHEWTDIYSYADKRWSVGNVYTQLGFIEEKHNPPAYWYVVNGKRKHRWAYRKDAIKATYDGYDATKTEYAMMLERGIDRVWDCGTIRYALYNS